jgi:hypothetical protein
MNTKAGAFQSPHRKFVGVERIKEVVAKKVNLELAIVK